MSINFKTLKRSHILSILICVMAVGLQIQATFFTDQTYTGLRVNVGDLILPFAGIAVLLSLLCGRSSWPVWSVRYTWVGLIGLLGVMSLALLQGYWTNGFLSQWALLNKYIGFLTLLSYLALGAWLATNECSEDEGLYTLFIKYFCGFYILVLLMSISAVFIESVLPASLWIGNYAWDGFMANRNAFMVVAVFLMIAMVVYHGHSKASLPPFLYPLFWTTFPFLVVFNASRTLWIVGGAILLIVFLINPIRSFKQILPFLVLGGALCLGFILFSGLSKLENMKQFSLLVNLIEQDEVRYKGDQKRLIAVEDGLELYKQSNPILGAGLGAYREFQTNKRDEFIDLIDFTALWLLVETGALGLLSFAAFFFLCLWVFYQRGFGDDPSLFHRTLFFFLIAFACMSVFHEITYTRFLWFAMGLGLVRSASLGVKNIKVASA